MPIVGRTLKDCVEQFRGILSKLSTSVLHQTKVVRTLEHDGRVLIGIVDGKGNISDVELDRREGAPPLFLRFWQTVSITPADGEVARGKRAFRLRTLEYNYHLSDERGGEPMLRWEYVRVPKDKAQYCRNHLQGRLQLSSGGGHVDFKKMHVPTGYLPLEEVFRFVIDDLGHRPPCGDSWPEVLEASKKQFHEELSSKPHRYVSPAR
jgi:hypothetical protein